MSSTPTIERQEVLELLRRVVRPPDEPIPMGATEDEIKACEQRLGLTFPDKLRAWLLACNGPCVGPGGIFGITPRRKNLDLEYVLRLYPGWLQKGWIPIAGDGCGNYYIVETKGEFGQGEPVIFIDTMEDESTPVYIAASHAWRFLKFLFMKELDESKWPFNHDDVVSVDPEILSFHDVTLPWNA